MSDEILDLTNILNSIDVFKKKHQYNPFDNYVWREVLTFDYLKSYYPTIKKLGGRYGADGICPELSLVHIEQKSTKTTKRKTTNDYNIRNSRYQFDLSKSLDKLLTADSFLFSLFDGDNSGYPVHVLFVYKPECVSAVKELVLQKQSSFQKMDDTKKTHAHIDLIYEEIELFGEQFGDYKPATNIMEFI
jgi:hypothetical protein